MVRNCVARSFTTVLYGIVQVDARQWGYSLMYENKIIASCLFQIVKSLHEWRLEKTHNGGPRGRFYSQCPFLPFDTMIFRLVMPSLTDDTSRQIMIADYALRVLPVRKR